MGKYFLAFVLLYLLIYIIPLGVRPLFVPDETRYAEIPREMIVSGDWVVPRLNGLRYFEKPVMGYWLNAVSMSLFGMNAFAVRLPSALSAGILALFVFLLAGRAGGSGKVAFMASAVFLTFQEVFFVGVFSVLDMMFTAMTAAGLFFYYLAVSSSRDVKSRVLFLFIFGIFAGAAFLTKGFIAFAVPFVVIVPYMFWEKRWKQLFLYVWPPLAGILLVSVPWAVAVHLREPDYWRYFFVEEHLRRFLSADGPKHPQPFFFFIPVILAGALPWTFVAYSSFSGLKLKGFREPLIKYLVCWLFFTFIFFSISRGKLATYILPCFPPLAVLFAVGLERYFKSGKTKSFNNGALILAGILGAGVLVVLSGYFFQFPYGKGEALKLGSGVAGLLVWALLLWCSGREKVSEKKFLFFAVAPLCFMLVSHFSVPGMVLRKKAPGTFFLSQAEKLNDDTVMVAYPSVAAAASWFYKRDDIYILHKGGELEYGLKYPDSGHRLMSFKEFEKFVGKSPGTVLIMEHRDKRDEYVPEGRREASQGELFFIEF